MNKQIKLKTTSILIWGITLFGISGTASLVQNEFTNGDICPQIIGIPACYIIMGCLIFALLSHSNFLKDKTILFYVGVLPALSIATVGSVGNLLGHIECPTTSGGTPMCYISFALFVSLLILKLLEHFIRLYE